MAPIRKRTTARAKLAKSTHAAKSPRDAISHPSSTHIPAAPAPRPRPDGFVDYSEDPAWRTSKKDKRAMKHNVLINKVRDGGIRKGEGKSAVRRRRPGRKIEAVEGLGSSLGDALPELDDDDAEEDEWEGVSEDGEDEGMSGMQSAGLRKRRRRRQEGEGKMVMKSLKHRPGAMKRKRAMEGREMERFGRNLAQLVGSGEARPAAKASSVGAGGGDAGGPSASQADRWAALRQFIGGSMEKDKAFAKG